MKPKSHIDSLNFSKKFPLNSLETSPPLASIAKMGEKLRKPIYYVFLHKVCISQNMSAMKYTYPMINSWRKTNYIEDPKIAKR
jgi:hypothetical protein